MIDGSRFAALHQPFEARTRRQPDSEALLTFDRTVTYGDLEQQSSNVAEWISRNGVGRDGLVAVCATRSPELIAGLMGVLRAGAAYLPIDPALPMGRVSALLDDSGATLLLTDQGARERLTGLVGTDLGRLIESVNPPSEFAPERRRARTVAADLAYVIYTSGSTGNPKGVMCTHGGIDNRLRWMQGEFGLTSDDVVLHKTSIGFDVSVWEVFWPLSEGARLALAPQGAKRDPELLGDFIRRRGVTVAHFVPAMLRMFVRSGEAKRATRLRLVVCSGEALPPELRDEFLAESPAQLHNLYGPTEASIDVTHHACRKEDPIGTVPIGRPISGVRLHILGDCQEVVPPGAEGEIHLGGIAIARGYYDRPDLTAAAFVPDPFEPGAVLYRTGDRARWMPNGELEYLGRRDDQIKVRGMRIELGEVEAAMSALPAVRDCAVLQPRASGDGLVGFVDDRAPDAGELHNLLGVRLPEAAIPAEFVRLAEIPRLSSGKVDRGALRKLYDDRHDRPPARRPAQTETEKTLAAVWSEVLGIAETAIGADANFFALGGDSIRSIEVVFRGRAAGLGLTTQDIFRWQTLETIASEVGRNGDVNSRATLVRQPAFRLLDWKDREKLPAGVVDAFPLSTLLRGLMAEAASNPSYRLYTTTLAIRGLYDPAALRRSVDELARRNPVLRSAFNMDGFSEPLQLVFQDTPTKVVEVDTSEMSAEDWAAYFREWSERERHIRMDFAVRPLFRLTAHRRPDRLLLTLAEPYLDGWSATLLLTELLSLYEANLTGRAPALPPPPEVSMADLVEAERRTLRGDGHRAAWHSRLAGAEETTLPRLSNVDDELRSPKRFPVPVSARTSQRLSDLSKKCGVPLKTVLLAAHARIVAVLSGREDVLFGLMVNGRPETKDGERAIGMFLNVVPLRMRVAPGRWIDLIQVVHEAEADVLHWRRYPYQQLLRDRGGRPLFDTVFNFTKFRPYADWSSDTVELLEVDGTDQTYFDLTVQASVGLGGEVKCALEFNPCGFSRRQVGQIISLYAQTLEGIANSAEARHENSPVLAAAERIRHRRPLPPAAPLRLEELLAKRVAESPDQASVIEGSVKCSYAALDRTSDAIAERILAVTDGDRPTRIGIYMRRSTLALQTMLAALKVGAAFVPVDPASPPARSAWILGDALPDLLLVDEVGGRTPPTLDRPVLQLRGSDTDVLAWGAENPKIGGVGSPTDAAHILYTSGSTGKPKGVVTSHAAMVNRLRWISRRFPGKERDVYCASGAIGFVDSITAMFSGLIDGVPVFMSPDPPPAPKEFAETLQGAGVTRLTIVPSVLRDLLTELGGEADHLLGGVGLWILSGEPLAVELVQGLRTVVPGATILNLYGSTEVAGDVTAHVCSGLEDGEFVPVGTPIDGVEVRVLDRDERDLPIGVSGEVVVSGSALASGYLGDEIRTRERFREPASGGPLHFRTGDLGRLRPDGALELVGRTDRQIKINGVRVEPGEIEAALVAHPAVREVAVTCRVRPSDRQSRLTAYVAGDATGPELRAFLLGRLPSALIPGVMVPVVRLPRTQSGKVDYPRLAESETRSSPTAGPRPGAPSSTERAVLEIWRDALDQVAIGLDDDFFELGGDSLLATRVLTRMGERLGARMRLRELFDFPTVRKCAARIDGADGDLTVVEATDGDR